VVAVVICLTLLASTATGLDLSLPGERSVRLRGYYKNFLLGIDSDIPQLEDGISDINRARLMLDADIASNWEFSVHYEHVAEINPLLGGGGFFELRDRPGLTPLSWSIDRTADLAWIHEVDRLEVRGRMEWGDVTIGRQAVGAGVGIIWAPLDLLAGFSPVQIDREYRLGVDAVRTVIPLGELTEIEAVYAAYDTRFDEQATAIHWRTTFSDPGIDIGLTAGKYFEDAVIGALASGEVRGVGVYGSINLTHHFGDDVGPHDFTRIAVGADHRFRNDVIGVVEYYFNGWGASHTSGYTSRFLSERLQRGEVFNVGRHYLGFLGDWEAHPLVHLLGRGQCNLTDPSAQVGPAVTVSLSDEAQLEAGAFFAVGESLDGVTPRSEFGVQPAFYYAAAKVYF
jgi:hypothetical protein